MTTTCTDTQLDSWERDYILWNSIRIGRDIPQPNVERMLLREAMNLIEVDPSRAERIAEVFASERRRYVESVR
jgi:hypothetical protein